MIERKRFSGVLDKDSNLQDVLNVHHVGAKNLRFVGGQNGFTAQNIKGNVIVSNSNLPAGTNECNGAFYDSVRQRVYWFNYNSNGNHGYYYYSIQTGTITQIFRCGVNSATDIFELSLNYPVTSVGVIYSDTGDLHYWTDGNTRPKYLNIDTVAAMGTFTADMINAAKNWPSVPPTCAYADDATATINYLNKKLFQFAYRWKYKNLENSTYSPYSEVPLPVNGYDTSTQADPTKNTYINVTVIGGGNDYQAIELVGRVIDGTATFSDFFVIDTFDRTEYNISPGASFVYKFFNDGSYPTVPTEQSDLYFSWLPDKANALEAINGNVIIYAGITEGFDKLERSDVDVALTSGFTSTPAIYGPQYRWKTPYRFGLIYFDDRGVTNGVVSFVGDTIDSTDFVVMTPNYSVVGGSTPLTPYIDASINHIPPSWASSYQWVRAAMTPKFLQFITCEFQQDSTFYYLCIENLEFLKDKVTGFLPSYEFTPGDRLVVLGIEITSGFGAFSNQLDFEILGVEERPMTAPNTANNGTFLKFKKLSNPPVGFGFVNRMYIDIYTPTLKVSNDQQIFYEFGERYGFQTIGGVRYHLGQLQNQTASQPATFRFTEGDVYYLPRDIYANVGSTGTSTVKLQSNSFSDFYKSNVSSNGRAWVIDENAAEVFNGTLVRWGGQYQPGTSVNQLNIFRPNDKDEVDRAKGSIIRLKTRGRTLRVFQQRGLGQYGIYGRFIQNNEGQSELVTTNEIITTNNIQYYQGVYGIGDYSTNLASTHIADYITDIITGRCIRLSVDGITDLGLLYKGQFYFPDWVLPFNKTITRANGATAKVMGYFDSYDNEYHIILQGGSLSGTTYDARHFSFNEGRNGFCCDDYDFKPEWALSAGGITFSWNEGNLYRHDSSTYCNFYGVQYNSEIELVFNSNIWEKKTWQAISEIANTIWEVPLAYTDVNTYGSQRQESTLISQEFTTLEGKPSAAFRRDLYSPGGKINGDTLKGSYLYVKLRKTNASALVYINEIDVRMIDSPLNVTA